MCAIPSAVELCFIACWRGLWAANYYSAADKYTYRKEEKMWDFTKNNTSMEEVK
jgi:hypothetical protein